MIGNEIEHQYIRWSIDNRSNYSLTLENTTDSDVAPDRRENEAPNVDNIDTRDAYVPSVTDSVWGSYSTYNSVINQFSWENIYDEMDWDAPNRLNISHEVVDRFAAASPNKVALTSVDTDGECRRITFGDLSDQSNRFANVVTNQTHQGARVVSYLPSIPEHYIAMIGALKAGMVWGSVNERYDSDRLKYHISNSDARVIITENKENDTVAQAIDHISTVDCVISIGDGTVKSSAEVSGVLRGSEHARRTPTRRHRRLQRSVFG